MCTFFWHPRYLSCHQTYVNAQRSKLEHPPWLSARTVCESICSCSPRPVPHQPRSPGPLTPTPGSVLSEHCWLRQAAPNMRNISLAALLLCPLHGFCSVTPFAQPLDVMAVASELYPFKSRRPKTNSDLHNEYQWGFPLVV